MEKEHKFLYVLNHICTTYYHFFDKILSFYINGANNRKIASYNPIYLRLRF